MLELPFVPVRITPVGLALYAFADAHDVPLVELFTKYPLARARWRQPAAITREWTREYELEFGGRSFRFLKARYPRKMILASCGRISDLVRALDVRDAARCAAETVSPLPKSSPG